MFYKVWSNHDANDFFEVVADDPQDAALEALAELGYRVASKGTERSEIE
jgi:hypothetical protein